MELYGLNAANDEGVSHSRKEVAVLPRKLVHDKDKPNRMVFSVYSLGLNHMANIEESSTRSDVVVARN